MTEDRNKTEARQAQAAPTRFILPISIALTVIAFGLAYVYIF